MSSVSPTSKTMRTKRKRTEWEITLRDAEHLDPSPIFGTKTISYIKDPRGVELVRPEPQSEDDDEEHPAKNRRKVIAKQLYRSHKALHSNRRPDATTLLEIKKAIHGGLADDNAKRLSFKSDEINIDASEELRDIMALRSALEYSASVDLIQLFEENIFLRIFFWYGAHTTQIRRQWESGKKSDREFLAEMPSIDTWGYPFAPTDNGRMRQVLQHLCDGPPPQSSEFFDEERFEVVFAIMQLASRYDSGIISSRSHFVTALLLKFGPMIKRGPSTKDGRIRLFIRNLRLKYIATARKTKVCSIDEEISRQGRSVPGCSSHMMSYHASFDHFLLGFKLFHEMSPPDVNKFADFVAQYSDTMERKDSVWITLRVAHHLLVFLGPSGEVADELGFALMPPGEHESFSYLIRCLLELSFATLDSTGRICGAQICGILIGLSLYQLLYDSSDKRKPFELKIPPRMIKELEALLQTIAEDKSENLLRGEHYGEDFDVLLSCMDVLASTWIDKDWVVPSSSGQMVPDKILSIIKAKELVDNLYNFFAGTGQYEDEDPDDLAFDPVWIAQRECLSSWDTPEKREAHLLDTSIEELDERLKQPDSSGPLPNAHPEVRGSPQSVQEHSVVALGDEPQQPLEIYEMSTAASDEQQQFQKVLVPSVRTPSAEQQLRHSRITSDLVSNTRRQPLKPVFVRPRSGNDANSPCPSTSAETTMLSCLPSSCFATGKRPENVYNSGTSYRVGGMAIKEKGMTYERQGFLQNP